MEFRVLGGPEAGPTLDLAHERFAYAGKFVMSGTGKAVAEDDGVVAAVAFSDDRTNPATAWLRYLTVRADRRGEGIGARLAALTAEHLLADHDRVRIAVNNPFAYEACYKAGFGFTGERTGLAELVLERPGERSPERYRAGLEAYREREDLADAERAFLDRKGETPPEPVDSNPAGE
ncbi:MAG: GNAT family N-acetyltransferase [Halobacteriales archaeon]